MAAFPSLRPALRAALAFLLGSLAVVNGAMHVKHVAGLGMAESDLTGLLAAVAGLVLVGLAAAIPWLHRGEGAGGARRRWARRVVAVPLGLLAAFYVVVPMGIAITETHKFREPIGAPPGPDYREVAFDASDGVHLSGWYRPTRNGATILVVHGGGGDRTGAVATPGCSSATATACCSTTPAAAAAARASRTRGAGAGRRTSPARSRS